MRKLPALAGVVHTVEYAYEYGTTKITKYYLKELEDAVDASKIDYDNMVDIIIKKEYLKNTRI